MFPESLSFSIPCCVSLLLNGTARLLCHRPRPADGRKHVEPGSRFINLPVIIVISYAPEAPSFAAFSTPEVSTGCSASAVFAFFSPPPPPDAPPSALSFGMCRAKSVSTNWWWWRRRRGGRRGGGGFVRMEHTEIRRNRASWSCVTSRVLQVLQVSCHEERTPFKPKAL